MLTELVVRGSYPCLPSIEPECCEGVQLGKSAPLRPLSENTRLPGQPRGSGQGQSPPLLPLEQLLHLETKQEAACAL